MSICLAIRLGSQDIRKLNENLQYLHNFVLEIVSILLNWAFTFLFTVFMREIEILSVENPSLSRIFAYRAGCLTTALSVPNFWEIILMSIGPHVSVCMSKFFHPSRHSFILVSCNFFSFSADSSCILGLSKILSNNLLTVSLVLLNLLTNSSHAVS